MIRFAASSALVAAAFVALAPLRAQAMPPPSKLQPLGGAPTSDTPPRQLEGVGIDERLGATLPLDVVLTDHQGKQVRLGDRFGHGRPVIVNLGYYGCPTLCGMVIQGLTTSLSKLGYTPGKEFDVVTVTIDPKETVELAGHKRESVLEALGKPVQGDGWTFHVAAETEIRKLADAIGFRYRWDPHARQWSHAAAVFVASPDGKLTRYLYGIEIPPNDLKLALVEAGEGRVGTTVDRLLLYCFHYDPQAGRYVLFARNFMKAGGLLTLFGLSAFLYTLWRKPRAAGV